jgi:hypothetical protein
LSANGNDYKAETPTIANYKKKDLNPSNAAQILTQQELSQTIFLLFIGTITGITMSKSLVA